MITPERVDSSSLQEVWAYKFLERKGWTHRRGTTAKVAPEAELASARSRFLERISSARIHGAIPDSMVINFDHTQCLMLPSSKCTFNPKGATSVPISFTDDKRGVSVVLGCSMTGDKLPMQAIYKGKTARSTPHSHPCLEHRDDVLLTSNLRGWANETTTIEYLQKAIVPYFIKKRQELGLESDHPGLAVYDQFRGQITEEVLRSFEEANITVVLVPGGWTSHLQPLDLTVMANFKRSIKLSFGEWLAEQTRKREEKLKKLNQKADRNAKRAAKGKDPKDVAESEPMSKWMKELTKTKNIRGPQIEWIVTALDSITKNSITAGFIKAGIVNPVNPPELLFEYSNEEDDDFIRVTTPTGKCKKQLDDIVPPVKNPKLELPTVVEVKSFPTPNASANTLLTESDLSYVFKFMCNREPIRFRGCFPLDLACPPEVRSCEHEFMFLNTAPHTSVGSHWLLAVTTIGEGNSLVVVDPRLDCITSTTKAALRFAFSNFDISFIKTGVQPATNNVICGYVVLFWALNMNHAYVSGSNLNIQDIVIKPPPGWYAEVNALLQTRQQSFRFWTETNPNSLGTQDQPVEL